MLALLLGCISVTASPVPGFVETEQKPSPPNTVKGVLKNGREGDFCMLRGMFLEKVADFTFTFQDEEGTQVEVRFKPEAGLARLMLQREYFLWASVRKDSLKTYLLAQLFSPSNH